MSDDNEKMMLGKLLSNQIKSAGRLINIHDAEFKVFSQWGDDGIIQYLIHRLEIPNKTFVEFGVNNYEEANTRFLLMNNNWRGMVMDSSPANVKHIKERYYYWQYDLLAVDALVDTENVNALISKAGFNPELGLLHIDIDGNDYWVWKSIHFFNPVIVILEYNSVFGIDKPWTIPYDPKFSRTVAHHSNLYYGASLLSLCDLADEKGYDFVGCNTAGNNAFFIRKDKTRDITVLSPEEGYVISNFSESRNETGRLTYVRGRDRLTEIRGMRVHNTRTNKIETLE